MLINSETKIIPGHGRPSNAAELRKSIAMLEDIRAKIQTEINAGATLEEVLSNSRLTAAYDSDHGTGFINPERIKEIIYTSLKRKE